MTDLVIFGFGVLVTVMTTSAVALLLYGAHQDGQIDREAHSHDGMGQANGKTPRRTA